jgi:hypothetical protein
LIIRPTPVRKNSATLIDNIFTNELSMPVKSGLLINDISDHLAVFQISGQNVKTHQKDYLYIRKRKITEDQINKFKEALFNVNWNSVMDEMDPNSAYGSFMSTFMSLYDKYCPYRNIKCNDKRYNRPYMTPGLRNACKKKAHLYKICIKHRTLKSEAKYKTYKNKLTSILRKAEKLYYNNLLEQNKNNMKGTWKILNQLMGLWKHYTLLSCLWKH